MVSAIIPENTYNTLDKVKILGHHIMEVICDEYSTDIQLQNKILTDYFYKTVSAISLALKSWILFLPL